MNSFNWKELVAAGGVVLSLVFVGVEISQNTSAAKGQTRTELAALNQEWLFLFTDPDFSRRFSQVWFSDDTSDVDPRQVQDMELLMIANIRRLENVYYQFREGLVDESALESYGFQTRAPLFLGNSFLAWWFEKDNRSLFDKSFVQLFETRVGISENEA